MIMNQPDINPTKPESYIMNNITDKEKECRLIVRRMDIIFSEQYCQVLNFTDVTSLVKLESEK